MPVHSIDAILPIRLSMNLEMAARNAFPSIVSSYPVRPPIPRTSVEEVSVAPFPLSA